MKSHTAYKESACLSAFYYALYRVPNRYLRKIIREVILRRKGGEYYSKILRKIYAQYHGIVVGMYSYGVFHPNFPPGTVIGRYTSMPRDLLVINASHPIKHRSSFPFFYNPDLGYVDKLLIKRRTELTIGNDVYIGLNVSLMPSVTSIGNGSVIAAGSVVIEDVPPFAIVGGNPAKIIKYRFSPKVIDQITKSAWWEKDIDEIKKNHSEFESFLKPVE